MRLPDRNNQEAGSIGPERSSLDYLIIGPEDFEEDPIIGAVIAGSDRAVLGAWRELQQDQANLDKAGQATFGWTVTTSRSRPPWARMAGIIAVS